MLIKATQNNVNKSRNHRRFPRMSRALTLLLCVCLLVAAVIAPKQSGTNVYADSKDTQKLLDATNEKISDLQEQQAALNDQLTNINDNLASVASQVSALNQQIDLKNQEISLKEDAIALKEQEIEEQQALIDSQYEGMKARIRYMYENKNVSYLQILLECGDLADFLNQVEYISDIAQYDREKLEEYKAEYEELEAEKAALQGDYEELDADHTSLEATQASAKSTQATLAGMATDAQNAIAQTEEDLADQIAAAEAYEAQIEREKLEEEMARAAALAAARAAGEGSWYENNYTPGEGDLILLAAIIYCEAGGESYEGQLAVGSVVMNRVNSSQFPSTIAGVIYQANQFAPVASGRFEMCLENGWYCASYSQSMSAAEDVLNNGMITNNYLFFHSLAGWTSDFGEVIGNQVFY